KQIYALAPNFSVSVQDPQLRCRNRLIGIERDHQVLPVLFSLQLEHASEIRARNSADLARRHPVFGKLNRLPWLQKRVRLLISKQTSLHFYVCAVVIRESSTPI